MILDKALILKGLGGLTALGGSAAAAYFGISSLGGDSDAKELLEKAGLKCTFNGNECEITSLESGKKINVKHNNTKVEEKTFTGSTSGPKIKVQKNVTEGGYNQNLRLTIEGGDIALTNGTTTGSSTITKLEQFETYEIKEDGDKWYLNRKTDALEGKTKALGLPTEDSACKLPSTDNSPATCPLDADKLKKINFDGKDAAGATIENGETGTITLKITKTSDTTTYPHGGYKFAFESNKDITISSTPSNKIMKNTNTEFKIKKNSDSNLTLEKAWTVTEWGKKVGLTCSSESSCTPGDTITGYKNGSTTKTNASVGEVGKSKTISVEKDQGGFNQGFKFTVSQEIDLTENSEKIATGSYEIKEDGGTWYLTKKETTTGG